MKNSKCTISLVFIKYDFYSTRCLMALIRGSKGFCPCPICFVEMDKQSDLSEDWPLRTAENTKTIIKKGREIAAATSRDDYLKDYSLRDIDVGISASGVLGLIFCSRMLFGRLQTRTLTPHSAGIVCTHIIVACSGSIYGPCCRPPSLI